MDLGDTVANVTLSARPGLITRQRQNLGTVRSDGVEVDAEARLGRTVFTLGWLHSDARVRSFADDPSLVGNRVPQIPSNQASATFRFVTAAGAIVAVQGRWADTQYDDDRNAFLLGSMRSMDALLSVPFGDKIEIFVAGENLIGGRYEVGRTPVLTLGPPRGVRAGARFHIAPLLAHRD
jgi:outer membrane receptor protein involved in Fe transport